MREVFLYAKYINYLPKIAENISQNSCLALANALS